MGRYNSKLLVLMAMLVAAAVLLSACGDDGGGTTASGSGESSEASESSGGGDLSAAEAAVEKAEEPAQLNLPAEPLDMKKNSGKLVYFIAPSLQIPFIAEVAKATQAAGKAADIDVEVIDGKGKVDVFNQGMSTAISQGADGIILQAIDPAIVGGPLAEAKEHGIAVVDMFNRGPQTPLPPTIGGQVTLDYAQSGRTMANFIAVDSGGEGDVGMVTSSIYQIYKEMVPAFEQELEQNCPDCELEAVKDTSPTGPPTEVQNITTALLRQFPEMDYVAPVSDRLAITMQPSVEAAGRPVKIVTADGSIPALEALEAGEPFAANVSDPPLEAVGWSVMDQVGRLMAGQKPSPEDADLPTQLFTAEAVPPLAERWPGFEGFEAEFLKVWGLR